MERGDQSRILVIAVSYETDDVALRFVRNLTAIAQGMNLAIVLVDNSERADSTEFFSKVRTENSDVLCVKPSDNLGYFGGASFGFKKWLSREQIFNWVIVSNVDVEFNDCSFFSRLRDMEQMENLGVVAPSIWSNVSQHDQNPMMIVRPSKTRMKFYKLIYSNYYLLNLHSLLAEINHLVRYLFKYKIIAPVTISIASMRGRRKSGTTLPGDGLMDIYAPHGACVIFSEEFFLRGGSLELPSFLFGEEIHIAETVRNLGLRVIYNPRLALSHDEHQSTGLEQMVYSREAASYLYESTTHIVDTYFR